MGTHLAEGIVVEGSRAERRSGLEIFNRQDVVADWGDGSR